jgi:hypothetical protein
MFSFALGSMLKAARCLPIMIQAIMERDSVFFREVMAFGVTRKEKRIFLLGHKVNLGYR